MSGDMISTLTSFCSNCKNNYCQNLKPQYFGGCMKWIGHRNSRVADSWKARLGVTSVAIPCHTQQQSFMTFTSEGTPHYTRVAYLFHEQQLPVRNSNHRGSANVRLYTKKRREKKFYCHARAWGYSGIRTSERRLSSAVQLSNPDLDPTQYCTRNYLSTLDKQSFNNRVYYSEGIVFKVPNLCATASSINKQTTCKFGSR